MSKIITGSERNFGAERRTFLVISNDDKMSCMVFKASNRGQIEQKMCPASSKPDFSRLRRAGNQHNVLCNRKSSRFGITGRPLVERGSSIMKWFRLPGEIVLSAS